MNDLNEELKDIKKDLSSLGHQIEGAKYMVSESSATFNFLLYLQRCLSGMHDKIAWEIKTHKNHIPNCS
jgi:hypothetical protein